MEMNEHKPNDGYFVESLTNLSMFLYRQGVDFQDFHSSNLIRERDFNLAI